MKKKEVVKTVGGLVVSTGVGIIVGNAIGVVAPLAGLGLAAKGCVAAGGYVLSSMIQDRTTTYMEQKVDEVVDIFVKEKELENKDEGTGA